MLAASVSPRTRTTTRDAYRAQVDGGLPGGVPASHHAHRLTGHGCRLGHCRPVEHAATDASLQGGDPEPAVRHAGGNDHGPCSDLRAVGEREPMVGKPGSELQRLPKEVEFGAEVAGLSEGPHRKVAPADAPREAQIVADPRGRPRLPADGFPFDDERAEAFR